MNQENGGFFSQNVTDVLHRPVLKKKLCFRCLTSSKECVHICNFLKMLE